MKQRRLLSVLVLLTLVVGAAFVWLGGEERRGARETVRPAIETTSHGEALSRAADVGAEFELDPRAQAGEAGRRRALDAAQAADASRPSVTAATSTGWLVGRIVDEQGSPLPGATVRAAQRVESLARKPLPGARIASTDVEGVFRIECRAGPAALLILKPGFVPTAVDRLLVAASGETTLDADIVVPRSTVVTGVVLDDTDAPVEDALVIVRGLGAREVRTGADGSFRLDQLERDRLEFVVTHEDHVSHVETIDTVHLAEQPHVTLRLSRGLVIEGRLHGVPAESTGPWSVATRSRFDWETRLEEQRLGEVDRNGDFRLCGLAEGSEWEIFAFPVATLDALANDTVNSDERVSELLTVEAGRRDVVLNWEPACTLELGVVDALTREPIEWLTVRAQSIGPKRTRNGERAEPHRYEAGLVRLVAPRPSADAWLCNLDIDAAGYDRWSKHRLELQPGQVVDLGTIDLVPAPRMRIMVIDDATGQPIPGAEVGWTEQDMELVAESATVAPGAWRERSQRYSRERIALTDEHGVVAFDGRPGFFIELTVTAAGYASALVNAWKLPETGSAETVVRLERGCVVEVLVREVDGQGLSGRTVDQRQFGLPKSEGKHERSPFVIDPTRSHAVTDAEGRVRFDSLGAGRHEFRLRERIGVGSLRMSRLPTPEELALDPGWTAVDVVAGEPNELVLEVPARAALFGRITERDRPLSGARVALFTKADHADHEGRASQMMASNDATITADATGRYRFEDVEPGAYVLVLTHANRATSSTFELTLHAGETQRNFDLDAAIITGRVLDSNGTGVAGIVVTVEPADQIAEHFYELRLMGGAPLQRGLLPGASTTTNAAGVYELRGVPTDAELFVTTEGGALGWQPARSRPMTVFRDQLISDVDLEIQRAGGLHVRCLGTDGMPVRVSFQVCRVGGTERMNESWSGYTGGTGQLRGLAPGAWKLRAMVGPHNNSGVEHEVQVVAGETLVVDLTLPR